MTTCSWSCFFERIDDFRSSLLYYGDRLSLIDFAVAPALSVNFELIFRSDYLAGFVSIVFAEEDAFELFLTSYLWLVWTSLVSVLGCSLLMVFLFTVFYGGDGENSRPFFGPRTYS